MTDPASSDADRVPRLWAIVGATGTGKSDLALDLAEVLRSRGNAAEIVNADAMQLYRGMDIGTAKLAPHERRGFPTICSTCGRCRRKPPSPGTSRWRGP